MWLGAPGQFSLAVRAGSVRSAVRTESLQATDCAVCVERVA
jgi:hypothetical protein